MLDTISLMSGDFSPMSISSQDLAQQLSGQLHLVSEIAESLTLRLLALEERFNELSERSLSVEPNKLMIPTAFYCLPIVATASSNSAVC